MLSIWIFDKRSVIYPAIVCELPSSIFGCLLSIATFVVAGFCSRAISATIFRNNFKRPLIQLQSSAVHSRRFDLKCAVTRRNHFESWVGTWDTRISLETDIPKTFPSSYSSNTSRILQPFKNSNVAPFCNGALYGRMLPKRDTFPKWVWNCCISWNTTSFSTER